MLDYQNIITRTRDILLQILIFVISPLLSLGVNIYNIRKGNYSYLWIISLIMSFIALFTPLFEDSYRHALYYLEYKKDIGNLRMYSMQGLDLVLSTLSYNFSKLNIPFEYIRALFTFLCYQISFTLLRATVSINKYSRLKNFNLFLIYFLSVPFLWIVNGMRMATAAYVVVLAWIYLYKYNKKLVPTVLCIISLLIHFASVLYILLLLAYSINKRINIRYVLIAVVALYLIFNTNILISLLSSAGLQTFSNVVNLYVLNSADTFSANMSLNGLIAMIVERIPIIVSFIYIIKYRNKISTRYYNFTLASICLFISTIPFVIIFQRLAYFITPTCLYIILNEVDKTSVRKILLISVIISQLSYIYGYRELFLDTPFIYIMISPLIYCFNLNTIENIKRAIYES